MSRPLENKVALVTGGSRGIGRGIAIGLGELGATVYITGRGSKALEETASLVRTAGGQCETFVVDHSDDDSVKKLFDDVFERLGPNCRLDYLVNNAFAAVRYITSSMSIPFWKKSASSPSAPDPNAPPGEAWDIVNNVGLRNNYICSAYALRHMENAPGGRSGCAVINVSSFGGLARLFDGNYGVGKAGVDRLSFELACDAPEGVSVFSYYPGFVSTETFAEFMQTRPPQGMSDKTTPLWNAESPLFVGRCLAAALADKKPTTLKSMHGKIVVAAEIASKYGVNDENGHRPLSIRSFKFILLSTFSFLVSSPLRHLIPNFLIPLWLMLLTTGTQRLW